MSRTLSPAVKKQVERGIAILRRGGIIAFPTDTVYGLGASMRIGRAVERVYDVKQRPRRMALPLLAANTSQISTVAATIPPVAQQLIASLLPGALTIVFVASRSVPSTVTAGGTTVAVRIPDHPIPLAVIEGLGAPLVGTSANISGRPSPLTAAQVRDQLGNEVDLVIDDGGRCPGRESTIVDVTGETPVILREGAISTEEISRVCGAVMTGKGN